MNFDFSPEQIQLRNEARRFLEARCPSSAVRAVLDGDAPYDRALWAGFAEMGFLGVNIPEAYGGLGLGHLELCVIAEELGRSLAPTPFSSSVYLATEFLLAAGNEVQKARWLPRLAAGEAIGTFAVAEGPGPLAAAAVTTRAASDGLHGMKLPVADGAVADFAVVAARTPDGVGLYLLDLDQPGVIRALVETLDPTRGHARLDFAGAAAELLAPADRAWPLVERVLDAAAVLTAFEQVGGADRALEMARDYALQRIAFGRPIGSFQAIKHMLADMYVSATLARSNAYFGAWALSAGAAELPEAAATARVSATQAYQHCARNGMQVHGGMGFTWELDCHLHYRRSNLLALSLGGLSEWEDRLVERLKARPPL
jgi:alkylation response protein AidB-like acyl-CoA dehydrogenase